MWSRSAVYKVGNVNCGHLQQQQKAGVGDGSIYACGCPQMGSKWSRCEPAALQKPCEQMKYVDPMFSVSVVIAFLSTFLPADCFIWILTLNNTECNQLFILIWGLYQRNKKYITVNQAKLNECLVMSFTCMVSVLQYKPAFSFRGQGS